MPKTNFDMIKEFSVEKMAEFFYEYFDCNFCPQNIHCGQSGDKKECMDLQINWLKQEENQ